MPLQSRTLSRPRDRFRFAAGSLENDTDILVAVRAQLPVERERAVGGRRVLHVDAHEVPARGRVEHDVLEVLAAEVEIELEAEPGELDRDVRVETFPSIRASASWYWPAIARASAAFVISSPSTSTVASLPFAFSRRTTRMASSSEGPAMYGDESRRTIGFGTTGRSRAIALSRRLTGCAERVATASCC